MHGAAGQPWLARALKLQLHLVQQLSGVTLRCVCLVLVQDTIAEEISSRDKQALSYCTAIRATYPSKGAPPTVEFSFSSNPFFSNSLLKRCLGSADVEEVTTDIQWKDTAHKLTVKVGGRALLARCVTYTAWRPPSN